MRPQGPDAGGTSPAQQRAWTLARHRAARTYHPDRGGDVATYLDALAAVDARFGFPAASDHEAPKVVGASRRRRRPLRAVRTRLPRWVPGARRYIQVGLPRRQGPFSSPARPTEREKP